MDKANKIDQETLKNLNRQIVLNYIRRNGEISRADLSKHTKLSPTTVSAIVAELVEKKMVREIRVGESNGGRKPLMMGINPDARYVLVLAITQKELIYTIANLDYHIIDKGCIKCEIKGTEHVKKVLQESLKKIVSNHAGEIEKFCGVGVSIPGVIDFVTNKVLYSSKLNLRDFDIVSVIQEYSGMKCFIYKDTDAELLGEYNFGVAKAYKNIVYINIDDGVGMSYINSGKLFQPGYEGGFELGHISIDSNGPLCRCGNKGCLGTVVSEAAVLEKLKRLIGEGCDTKISDVNGLKLSDIVAFSNLGDKVARCVLEEQARLLGVATAIVINLLNPELIVVGGPLSECRWNFLDILRDTVRQRSLDIYSKKTEIKFAKLQDEAVLLGIANDIFEIEVFKHVGI